LLHQHLSPLPILAKKKKILKSQLQLLTMAAAHTSDLLLSAPSPYVVPQWSNLTAQSLIPCEMDLLASRAMQPLQAMAT
jgi:hypothetical protein